MKLVSSQSLSYKKTSKLKLLTCAVWLLLLSCAKQDLQTSDVSHDDGQPTRTASPVMWFSEEEKPLETYAEQSAARGFVVMKEDEGSTIRDWAQHWIDGIDARLRRDFPDDLAATPRPKVALIRTANPNAFISSDFGCVAYPTRATDSGLNSLSGNEPGIIFMSDFGPIVYPLSDLAPLKISCDSGSSEMIEGYLDYFNSKSKTGCVFEKSAKSANGAADVSGCELVSGNPEKEVDHIVGLLMARVNPFVNLNLGLFDLIEDEQAYISILAHELGHYYRSHSNAVDSEYNYTYRQEGLSRLAGKPLPSSDPELQKLGEKVQLAGKAYASLNGVDKGPSFYEIAPVNFFAAGGAVKLVCGREGASCPQVCESVLSLENEETKLRNMVGLGNYPFGKNFKGTLVNEVSSLLSSCLTSLGDELEPFAYDPELKDLIYGRVLWNPHVEAKAQVVSSAESFVAVYELANLGKTAEQKKSGLLDTFSLVRKTAENIEKTSSEIYREAYENRVGWYTAEQEADDIATEFLSYLGIDPAAGARAFLAIQKDLIGQFKDDPVTLGLGYDNCKSLFDVDFNASQTDTPVPVGDFVDDHHSTCYRAFNIVVEVGAHGYRPAKVQPEHPYISYADVRREVSAELEKLKLDNKNFVSDEAQKTTDQGTNKRRSGGPEEGPKEGNDTVYRSAKKLKEALHINCRFDSH